MWRSCFCHGFALLTGLEFNCCTKGRLQLLICLFCVSKVGWQPIYDGPDLWWKKMINIIHPISVILLILIGYIIQYAACFRRDRAGEGFVSIRSNSFDHRKKTNTISGKNLLSEFHFRKGVFLLCRMSHGCPCRHQMPQTVPWSPQMKCGRLVNIT